MEFYVEHEKVALGKHLDLSIWAPFLSQLNSVVIISQLNPAYIQPPEYSFDIQEFKLPAMERDMERWLGGLREVAEIFAEYLPTWCSVGFDANDKPPAEAVMDACVGDRWRKVQTHNGDRFFGRKGFRLRHLPSDFVDPWGSWQC